MNVFVLATPETGAEWLLRALGCLPGVTCAPVPTHVFSQGIGALLDTWATGIRDAMGERANLESFLDGVRRLADAPLAAWRRSQGADWVAEYSPDHIGHAGALARVYPDAHFVHLVRDGRQVARSLSSPLLDWSPPRAAWRWCDDQRAVAALGEDVKVHTVRLEDLLRDPTYYLDGLASRLGIDAGAAAVGEAAARLGSGKRAAPAVPVGRVGQLVDVLGGDLLVALGYEVDRASAVRRLLARAELSSAGEVAWMVRAATRRFVAERGER